MDFFALKALFDKLNSQIQLSNEEMWDEDMYYMELELSEQGTSSLAQLAESIESEGIESEEEF